MQKSGMKVCVNHKTNIAANIEKWLASVSDVTFRTVEIQITREEAQQIVGSYESKKVSTSLNSLVGKIDNAIANFSNGAFVKLREAI